MRVTEALTLAGLIDPTWYAAGAAQRGTAVHAATALDDLGDLDETSVDPIVAPYLESWRKLRDQMGWKFRRSEIEVELRRGTLVGHVDRLFGNVVLDVKSGSPEPWHAIQTALYASLHGADFASVRRYAVYVHDDGSIADLRRHESLGDLSVANAVVTLAAWRKGVQS